MTVVEEAPPRAWIAEQLDELHVHGEVALAGADPEGVHQLRVAVRRIRAVLKASRFDDGGTLLTELRWFFGELGPLRDLDVLIDRFHQDTEGFSKEEMTAFNRLLKTLRTERTTARRQATKALKSKRYANLLKTLATITAAPNPQSEADLVAEIARPFRKLRKAVTEAGPDPEDQVLHALRIRGKKLRYAAELAAPTGGKPVRKLVKATKRLQDILGEHQDACIAEQRIRTMVTTDPAEAFIAGRLVERERTRQAKARTEWQAAYQEINQAATALLP